MVSWDNVEFFLMYFYNNVSNIIWEHVYKFETNLIVSKSGHTHLIMQLKFFNGFNYFLCVLFFSREKLAY